MKRSFSMRASVFWRCLLAFVVFWAVMMVTLTVRENDRVKADLRQLRTERERYVGRLVEEKLADGPWDADKTAAISRDMTSNYLREMGRYSILDWSVYYRGERVGRTGISVGLLGTADAAWYDVCFDDVLTDDGQVALAVLLRRAADWPGDDDVGFYPEDGAGWLNVGRYAPVERVNATGVIEGGRLYPQKLEFVGAGERREVLECSNAEFFAGKELTELECTMGWLYNSLEGKDPAKILHDRRRQRAWVDSVLEERAGWYDLGPGEGGAFYPDTNGRIEYGRLYENLGKAVPDAVTAYTAVTNTAQMAIDRVLEQGTYLWTFLVMVVLAVLLSLALSWALSGPLAKLSKAVEEEKLPYTPDSRIREVNVMARAVNEAQKKLSDDLERQRELTRAVAHELKTPAAVLRAYAEGLHEDIAPEKREEYLRILMEESDRMGALVNELLEFSRLEQGRAPLELERVDLAELTERMFCRLELPMEQRGLTLDFDLAPVTLTADPARLGQVLDNLASNALRYADPGAVKVRLSNEGGTARLSVENACAPIPEDVLAKLFQPFYRPDKARSRELGGSGLGLAIVANVVQLHGGTCGVEAVDGGIRFTVELPLGKEEQV